MENMRFNKSDEMGNFLTVTVIDALQPAVCIIGDMTGRAFYALPAETAIDQVDMSAYDESYIVYENVTLSRSKIGRVDNILLRSQDYTLKLILEELKKKLADIQAQIATLENDMGDALVLGLQTEESARTTADNAEVTARNTAITNHANLTTAHGAVSTATASKLMVRDASGRCKVVAPSAEDDIALKSNVTSEATARGTAITTHAGLTTGVHGIDSYVKKPTLRTVTGVSTYTIPAMSVGETVDVYCSSGTGVDIYLPTGGTYLWYIGGNSSLWAGATRITDDMNAGTVYRIQRWA
jgi:hypothetical protein